MKTDKLILDKVDNVEIDGKFVYVVYKTSQKKLEEGTYRIEREAIDIGHKKEMESKYQDLIDIEDIANKIENFSEINSIADLLLR